MAESPAHKFGQIIGNLLEEIILPILQKFCGERKLFLDKQGLRGKARKGKKVRWKDKYGNSHDLDFVIENGGSADQTGKPLAFIEVAWRRYTKHSKNKAQEIQGAILPIAELYESERPFLGAIVAGEFTQPSIKQLTSVGFDVLYFPYKSIILAFKETGINVNFDESTPDKKFQKCIKSIEALSDSQRLKIKQALASLNSKSIKKFIKALNASVKRSVIFVGVTTLYGDQNNFETITEAMNFIRSRKKGKSNLKFQKYEIFIKFNNKDLINGTFKEKKDALDFLQNF